MSILEWKFRDSGVVGEQLRGAAERFGVVWRGLVRFASTLERWRGNYEGLLSGLERFGGFGCVLRAVRSVGGATTRGC